MESILVALHDPWEEARTCSTAPWAHTAVCAVPLGSLGEKPKNSSPLPGHLLSFKGTLLGLPGPQNASGAAGRAVYCVLLSPADYEHCAQPPRHDSPTHPALNTPLMNPKGSP